MSHAAPAVYTIPTGAGFLDTLAAGLLREAGGDPLALAAMTVLVPNRRAVRGLREALLRAGGGRPLVLPAMRPVGDVDEDALGFDAAVADTALDIAPAVEPTRRVILLSRLIERWRARDAAAGAGLGAGAGAGAVAPAQAVDLARDLAGLIDALHTEGIDADAFRHLVPEAYASHWQVTLRFLDLVTDLWPALLAAEGALDPAARRDRLVRALADAWRAAPPEGPVIAAGSTGTVPATAELLGVVARLPRGRVVLPGFDTAMDRDSWDAIDPQRHPAAALHPQAAMRQLLDRLGVDRAEVRPWPLDPAAEARAGAVAGRVEMLREALRPAETVAAWRRVAPGDRADPLPGLSRVDLPTLRAEAAYIALALREALETPGKTAALVTPDRRLGRMVAAELRRWSVAIDDSAGEPLGATVPGVFLRLLVDAAAGGFRPVALLSLLKHPLAAGGLAPARCRALARALDARVLRGPRPVAGLAGVTRLVERGELDDRTRADWARVAEILAPLEALLARGSVALAELVATHVRVAEALAASDAEPGAERLYAGEAGHVAADALARIGAAADALEPLAGDRYPALFTALIADATVRPRFGRHPRLSVWGPIEARLQQADLMILGGLNEGSWPPDPGHDPWMSRPMRHDLGLPALDRRVGQSAHDFVEAAAAPEVVLTRAEKVDGAPTVPSRWLVRLDAMLGGLPTGDARRRAWLDALDRPAAVAPLDPPRPTPPVAARPPTLSVTQVETWMRDPYALYARKVLDLAPLDALEADPQASDRGVFMHAGLEAYFAGVGPDWPDDAAEGLIAAGWRALDAQGLADRPAVVQFWWPRYCQVARWIDAEERRRRATGHAPLVIERMVAREVLPGFTLKAKADRVDRLADGRLAIIDYKTGMPPTDPQLAAGFAPQLPLEGWLAQLGAFGGVDEVGELAFWHVRGGDPAVAVKTVKKPDERIAQAREGLAQLVAAFRDPATPYLSQPRPDRARGHDYDHLARVKEWQDRLDGQEDAP
ncbi:double-strand break repair protein AddB [Rhodothalassium salexigens]|uniref:double-strand break repair protein AddB n=1 Tax=Rhodothalassium salexigens TaxID=1086 RepID=UPI0019140B8D|nr:double-strand break repair protein AddB [Rhodothalassium salexigens]MBK5910016.1 double-strand break repair protein AddB [Rhodothalassium salexigens]